MEDVQYTPSAAPGKQCKECKFFAAGTDGIAGKCFGHDVVAQGGCNKFTGK
ncbi:hypothetical protein ACFL0Z_01525 [Patescibacteria group bacterium]